MKFKTKSFLRIEEYKALSNLQINGKILDVGGSKKSSYHELIKGEHIITVGNIDDNCDVDVLFDAQKRWPFEDQVFEGVLFINVLEHLFDYQAAIKESCRVLKSDGVVVGVVPFVFNVHASPNDYFRYTRSALEKIFLTNGFTTIEIKELGSGAFSVAYHSVLSLVRFQWMSTILIPVFRFFDSVISFIKPNSKMSKKYFPLGYYFEVRK